MIELQRDTPVKNRCGFGRDWRWTGTRRWRIGNYGFMALPGWNPE